MMMRSKQNILPSASSCAIPRDNNSLQQPGTARTSCSLSSVEEDVFYDTRSSVSLQQLLLRSELEDEVSSKFSPSRSFRTHSMKGFSELCNIIGFT
jgi:hypothetical protein